MVSTKFLKKLKDEYNVKFNNEKLVKIGQGEGVTK